MMSANDLRLTGAAIQLLWTYETMYAQLAAQWPSVYQAGCPPATIRTAKTHCNTALDELVLATIEVPPDARRTAAGRPYKTQTTLSTNLRNRKKVIPTSNRGANFRLKESYS
jgi:hypothetical protein